MRYDENTSPEEIRADIEQTRRRMDSTLEAIERRLSPDRLMDIGADWLRSSNARQFASNLGAAAKNNPLPLALIGLGLAWLWAGGSRRAGYLESAEGPGRAGSAARRAGDAVSSARERVSGATEAARERYQGAKDKVVNLSEAARRQADRARGGYDRMLREQPLALGAVGLALGAIAAAATPRTQAEDELMGEARDRLAGKAAELGAGEAEKARDTLEQRLDPQGPDNEPRRETGAPGGA